MYWLVGAAVGLALLMVGVWMRRRGRTQSLAPIPIFADPGVAEPAPLASRQAPPAPAPTPAAEDVPVPAEPEPPPVADPPVADPPVADPPVADPPVADPIIIRGLTLSPRQYRGLFPDLTAALPDEQAAARHYLAHGRREIAAGRRTPRPELLLELELQQLSPLAPAEPRAPNWCYFPGTNGTLDIIVSHNAPAGAFAPAVPAKPPTDGDARLYLKGEHNGFYQHGIPGLTDSIDATARWLEQAIARLRPTRIRTLGVSSGGYGAILYGHLLGADAVHAVAPEIMLGLPQYRSALWFKEARYDPAYRDLRPFLPALNARLSIAYPAYEPLDYRMLQACRAAGLEHLGLTADFHPGGNGALLERAFGAATALVPPEVMIVRRYMLRYDDATIERIATAHEAIVERDYARSGALLRDAVAADPANAGFRCHLGVHRFLEGDPGRAEDAIRAAMQEIAVSQGGGSRGRLVARSAKQIVRGFYDGPREQIGALEAIFDRAFLALAPAAHEPSGPAEAERFH